MRCRQSAVAMAAGRFARSVAAVAAVAVLAACSAAEERGPQPILGWSVADDVVHLWIGTCNGDPETEVVEADDTVTITVVSTRRDPGDACQDSVSVSLQAPLDGRAVIDGATGREAEPMEG
ncbi:hypothetical protein [uncultured Modestobacter sp.]|uniref:hypothetical protein n=1 Tax=uncultured Modestobacter sp. TaxID=380048 RepID=UPI00262E1149|nr:hypothetical protein [uncultured Modestobacter sp.]